MSNNLIITDFLEPFKRFEEYFEKAKNDNKIIEPTAMCLSSVDGNGEPSSRIVLLKKFNNNGFYFFTNLTSRKGREIIANPNVALCFFWASLGMQIRISGKASKISDIEADEYFATRPKDSQIGAWASKQSSEMSSWQEFEDRIKDFDIKFANCNVARPEFWSGFCVNPKEIEFWFEGKFRIHRRELYKRNLIDNSWQVTKLYP